MSSVSKSSSRSSSSSSSGFSSINQEQFPPTFNLQTILHIEQVDLNARPIFCGEQDNRLNELRRMTGAIIDLHVVPGTRRPFERVDWTVSHRNPEVCDFVLRRLNYWMQETQLICDMAYEDTLFLKKHGVGEKLTRTKQAPPNTSLKFAGRQRTRSLTESDEIPLTVEKNRMPGTPMTCTYKREGSCSTLPKRLFPNMPISNTPLNQYETQSQDLISSLELEDLLESARWASLLSDTSDHEVNEGRVCFADTVSLSKLAECLRQNPCQSNTAPEQVDEILREKSIKVTSREHRRRMSNQDYVFHRLILDGHIQFPVGISKDTKQARKLAYRQMLDVCLNASGVQMKKLIGNRVKVVKRPPTDEQDIQTNDNFDGNATYLTMADFSTLSNYQGSY